VAGAAAHTLTGLFDGPTTTRAVGDAQPMAVGMIRDIEKPGSPEGDLRPLATEPERLAG